MSFTRASAVPPPKLSTSRSTGVDCPGSCLPSACGRLSGGPGEGGPCCPVVGPSGGRCRPVARNGTPARRVLLVAYEPCGGVRIHPGGGGFTAAPTWARRSPGRPKTLRGIRRAAGGPPSGRPAWWVRGDAPSMGGQALGAGTCSYGAPARRAAPQPASSTKDKGSEEDLPAQHQETGQEPRVSAPDVHPCRQGDPPGTPGQRSPPPVRLRAAAAQWSGASGTGRRSRRCGATDSAADGDRSP